MTAAGPELVSASGAPTKPRPRLGWLDGLRGVAVLAVVLQHAGELTSRRFATVTHDDAQLGQGGVLLFFLVSGFVIPMTLDRRPSLATFAINRFARLYPAYWASIFGVYLCWHFKVLEVPRAFRHDSHPWLANLTMLQTVLGRPQLQGQYWSLLFELTFYGLCGLLLALGVFRRSVAIAVLALGTALGLHVLARIAGHTAPLGLGNVATMFVGSVMWRVHSGAIAARTGWRVYAAGLIVTQAVLVTRLQGHTDGSTGVALTLLPMAVAWGGAYVIFGLAFHYRERLRVPRWLVFVGEVSYSVYLLHPLAFAVIGSKSIHDVPLRILAWAVLSVAFGWLSWRLVERPASFAGRRLTGGTRRSG